MKKFIVTGANGDIAEGVCRTLRDGFETVEIVGTDIGDDAWPALDYCDKIVKLPRGDAESYCGALSDLVLSEQPDLALVLTEMELRAIAQSSADVEDVSDRLLMVDPKAIMLFTDKSDGGRWLAENGFPCPETHDPLDVSEEMLPVIFKPRTGSGSKGLFVAQDAGELAFAKERFSEGSVAQALIEGDDGEHTVGVFRWAGKTQSIIMQRKLRGGMSGMIRTVIDPNVAAVMTDLAERLDLEGCINVQYRLQGGRPMIFEINPRISSTVRMRHILGFSDLLWWVRAKLDDESPPQWKSEADARVYRLSREVKASSDTI